MTDKKKITEVNVASELQPGAHILITQQEPDEKNQGGTIESLRRIPAMKLIDGSGKRVYNVCDYGAVGDGVHNDAPAIRSAIAALPESNFVLYFPPGTYLQGDGSNSEPTYFSIYNKTDFEVLGYGATVIAHPGNSCIQSNRGFWIEKCNNGVIAGITYNGNIEERKPAMGDSGTVNRQSAFQDQASRYITFRDCTAIGACMDGFTVQLENYSGEIVTSDLCALYNCVADKCYRQGLSVVGGAYGIADHCSFTNNGTVYGTSPMFGVDLESNMAPHQDGWVFQSCYFTGNVKGGLTLSARAAYATIRDCTFDGDSLQIVTTNNKQGYAKVVNNTFINTSMSLNGGALLFEGNVCINSAPMITNDDLGTNRIVRNVFLARYDLAAQPVSGGVVSANRTISLRASRIVFDDNDIINYTGTSIISTTSRITSFCGNRIYTTYESNEYTPYFTAFGKMTTAISADILERNVVGAGYQFMHDSGESVIASTVTRRLLYQTALATARVLRIGIGPASTRKANMTYKIELHFKNFVDVLDIYNNSIKSVTKQSSAMYAVDSDEDGNYFILMHTSATVSGTFIGSYTCGAVDAPGIAYLSGDVRNYAGYEEMEWK